MPLQEIFRSPSLSPCEHRAFVLRAVGIGSEVRGIDSAFGLFVEAGAVALAREQLKLYEKENAAPLPVPRVYEAHRLPWVASALYSVVLLAVGFLAGRNTFGFDWYDAGALTRTLNDEWWRAITALTLHADHQHLISNLGFGALFLFLAARFVGAGASALLTLASAALANALDALLMPTTHVAIGASTLVFATLGLLSAYSWRVQLTGRSKWAHRFAPLIAGVMLLGFLGTSGERTDVLAHLLGFACGVPIGLAAAALPSSWLRARKIQLASALAFLGIFALAWRAAL